ncbi:hypothetical protein NWE48_23595 [Escherichia coli]|nr:hypothetical protein [Escherichia coli]
MSAVTPTVWLASTFPNTSGHPHSACLPSNHQNTGAVLRHHQLRDLRRANISNKVHRFYYRRFDSTFSLNSAASATVLPVDQPRHTMRIRPDICALFPHWQQYSCSLRHRKGDGLLRQHIAKLDLSPGHSLYVDQPFASMIWLLVVTCIATICALAASPLIL